MALGSPTGFLTPGYTELIEEQLYLGAVSLGDLNVDGHLDAAFATGDVVFGNGDGTFTPGGRFDYGHASAVRIAEFTSDGMPDILAAKASGGVWALANDRGDVNQPPAVDAGPDVSVEYSTTQGEGCSFRIGADAIDPDAHALTYEWRRDGTLIGTDTTLWVCGREVQSGSYVYSVTVRDARGGITSDSMNVTILPTKEIVLWTSHNATSQGNWSVVADATAAGGATARDANLGAPKVTPSRANPTSYLALRFIADPTQTYKLWVRLKADGNSYANDSIWVQFTGATDVSGNPRYRFGSTDGLGVNLEECSGCRVSGWGWEDDGWGAANRNGVRLRFPGGPDGGEQYLLIQTREERRIGRSDCALSGEVSDRGTGGGEERHDHSRANRFLVLMERVVPLRMCRHSAMTTLSSLMR